MPVTKTWVVTSDNPRPTHADIDGETIGMDETFSNGLAFPGDGNTGDAAETANCTCVMAVEGSAAADWASPGLDQLLESGKLDVDGEIGRGASVPHWGTVEGDGRLVDVVVKDGVSAGSDASAELAAQALNDEYGFGLNMPRLVLRGEGADEELVVALVPDAKTGTELYREAGPDAGDLLWDSAVPGDEARALATETSRNFSELLKELPLEDRQRMAFFDAVIGNEDRNLGNWLIDARGRLVAIDHGLAFSDSARLAQGLEFNSRITETLTSVEREMTQWQHDILENLLADEESFRELWDGFVDCDALFERVRKMLEEERWWQGAFG